MPGLKLEDIVKASKEHEKLLTADEVNLKKIQEAIDDIRKKEGYDRYKEMLGFLEATRVYGSALQASLEKRIYTTRIKEGLEEKEKIMGKIVDEFKDKGVIPGQKVLKGDPTNHMAAMIGLAMHGEAWYKKAMELYKEEGDDTDLKAVLADFTQNYALHAAGGKEKADDLLNKIKVMIKEGKLTRDAAHGGENAWDTILKTVSGGYSSRHTNQILQKLIGDDQNDHYNLKKHIAEAPGVKKMFDATGKKLDESALYGENILQLAMNYAGQGDKYISDAYKKKTKEKVDLPT